MIKSQKSPLATAVAPAKVDVSKPLFAFNIETKTMNNESVRLINARDLHTQLQVGRMFAHWIKDRIDSCNFIENQDFILVIANFGNNPKGGRPSQEYFITIDMAKHLAMLEKNEIGHKARQYFIEVERQYRNLMIRPVLISDLMLQIPREWEKTFPDEFFKLSVEMITGNEFDRSRGTPSCIGGFINKYVYNFLDADIVRIAKQMRDSNGCYAYIHQFLDAKFGSEALKNHISTVINMMKASSQDYDIFKTLMNALLQSKSQKNMLLK